jgi:hypothetical protein
MAAKCHTLLVNKLEGCVHANTIEQSGLNYDANEAGIMNSGIFSRSSISVLCLENHRAA